MKKPLCVVVLLVVGLSLVYFSPSALWAQGKGPIKIGFIAPLFRWNGVKREGHVSRFRALS